MAGKQISAISRLSLAVRLALPTASASSASLSDLLFVSFSIDLKLLLSISGLKHIIKFLCPCWQLCLCNAVCITYRLNKCIL